MSPFARNTPVQNSPTGSRFYLPVLELLQANSPRPMSVSEIIAAILADHPDERSRWKSSSGGVRSLLLRMAGREDSPICQVPNLIPPKFFVPQMRNSVTPVQSVPRQTGPSPQINSIFYKPACEILKREPGRAFSANEVMKAIIEQYPELEWSHSQGPIRAMLLSAAGKEYSHIKQIPNVQPPQFQYRDQHAHGRNVDVEVEASPEEILGNAFAQTQTTLKKKLLEKVRAMDPTAFEHLANRLIAKLLFGEAEDTQPSRDGGIDGLIHLSSDPLGLNVVGIQAKRYAAGNVQSQEIQQFVGALHGNNGVFVTCADYSANARREAERATQSKIVLINGSQLVDYMVKYKVGVSETGIVYALSKIDDDFFDGL